MSWDQRWWDAKIVLKVKNNEAKRVRKKEEQRLDDLQKVRVLVALNGGKDCTLISQLNSFEQEARDIEQKQAIRWRRWVRLRWLTEGDAPLKYFFAIMKTKRLEITSLVGIDLIGKKIPFKEIERFHSPLPKGYRM